MKQPKFTIVIPALNEEKFLPNLLTSLSEQSYRDFEVIVVDGKSKDKTVEKAKSFSSKLPKLTVINADHPNLPYQRNLGAEKGNGEWFIFIDADSVVLPYACERIAAYIKNHDCSFVTSWCRADSERTNEATLALFGNLFYEASKAIKRPLSPGPFTIVRRKEFFAVNGYDVQHPFLEDQDFSQRMTRHGVPLHIIRETLYQWSLRRYRKHGVLSVLEEYAKAVIPIALFYKTPKNLNGYVMGGQAFSTQLKKSKSLKIRMKKLEKTVKTFVKDVFE